MSEIATIGHNMPPVDPIEAIQSKYDDVFAGVEMYLDGTVVETEGQMKEADRLIAGVKDAEKEAGEAKEAEYRPHKAACDAVVARWKPFLDDLARQKKGLLAVVDGYKRKLAAEKAEAERKARAEAEAKMRAAQEAARQADETNIEAQRAAAQAQWEAEEAQRRAIEASKDKVKGLRAFDVTEVLDGTAYARWLWQNDRDPLLAWMQEHATRCRHHIPGVVETRKERRAV